MLSNAQQSSSAFSNMDLEVGSKMRPPNDSDDFSTDTSASSSSGSSEYLNLDIFIKNPDFALDSKTVSSGSSTYDAISSKICDLDSKLGRNTTSSLDRQRPLKRFIDNEIDELNVMNNLNGRMFNFVNMVKSETLRSSELQQSLLAKKQELADQFKEQNASRYESLMAAKQKLNELCCDVSKANLRERQGRLLAKWYASQINFELENSNARNKSSIYSQQFLANQELGRFMSPDVQQPGLKEDDFVFQRKDNDQTPLDSNLLMTAEKKDSLSANENESSSLKSSLSCLSSSSFSCTSPTFSHSPSPVEFQSASPLASPSLFPSSSCSPRSSSVSLSCSSSSATTAYQHLDLHLNSLIQQRIQLETHYERKLSEYTEIKENAAVLENNLDELHTNLDTVRIGNTHLNQQVSLLRREIDFYRKLKQTSAPEKPREKRTRQAPLSGNYDELVENLCGQTWFQRELVDVKKEVREEFDEFNRQQLDEYEAELKAELMSEIERNEKAQAEEDLKFDAESDEALDDLSKLNQELSEGLDEYLQVLDENSRLNARLVDLSTRMCSFTQLGQEQQERMVACYTIQSLKSKISARNTEISNYKLELSTIKDYLIHKDLFGVLGQNEKKLKEIDLNINEVVLIASEKKAAAKPEEAAPNPAKLLISRLNKCDLLSLMLIENFKQNPIRLNVWPSGPASLQTATTSAPGRLMRHSPKIKLRANYAQIEYSKSKLFGFFVINFDLINNSFQSTSDSSSSSLMAANKRPPTKSKSSGLLASASVTAVAAAGEVKTPPAKASTLSASNLNNSLNFLRVIDSSTDGHSIMIENSHKILDFDLSEWTIRREIQNTTITGDLHKLACASVKSNFLDPLSQEPPIESAKGRGKSSCADAMNYLAANLNAETSNDMHDESSFSNSNLVQVVQYKFPKGFRLKRRKKIILVAADALDKMKHKTHTASSSQHSSPPPPPASTQAPSVPSSPSMAANRKPIAKPKPLPKSKTVLSLSNEAKPPPRAGNKSSLASTISSASREKKPIVKPSSSMLSLASASAAPLKSLTPSQSSTMLSASQTSSASRQSPPKTLASTLCEPASIKCSCCACTAQRVNLTRNGDAEIFEVKEVANWGKGLMVVTKFINNKNVVKFINYKCIKNIWLNSTSYEETN